ncbi:hypothetical protein ACHAP5_010418 [Fusarium lateritium]
MCQTNSPSQVCGIPLSIYTAKQRTNIKPNIYFCPSTRGAILNALLHLVHETGHPQGRTSQQPNLANMITSKSELWWKLVTHCHLNHGGSHIYKQTVYPALRGLIKWMLRKAIEFGIATKTDDGWTCRFQPMPDNEAGVYFNHRVASSGQRDGPPAMPDLATLSLQEEDYKSVAHVLSDRRKNRLVSEKRLNKKRHCNTKPVARNEGVVKGMKTKSKRAKEGKKKQTVKIEKESSFD